jgi:hypothetical protein
MFDLIATAEAAVLDHLRREVLYANSDLTVRQEQRVRLRCDLHARYRGPGTFRAQMAEVRHLEQEARESARTAWNLLCASGQEVSR